MINEQGRHYTDIEVIYKIAKLNCFFKTGHGTDTVCSDCINSVEKTLETSGISPELIEDMAISLLNAKGIYDDTKPSATQLEYAFNVLKDILPTISEKFNNKKEN